MHQRYLKLSCDTNKFFDRQNLISFIREPDHVHTLEWGSKKRVDVRVFAKNSKGEDIAHSDLITFDLGGIGIVHVFEDDLDTTKINTNKEGKTTLNEGIMFKNKIANKDDDLLWQRTFYFANFIAKRDSHYEMTDLDIWNVVGEMYRLTEYNHVAKCLREKLQILDV